MHRPLFELPFSLIGCEICHGSHSTALLSLGLPALHVSFCCEPSTKTTCHRGRSQRTVFSEQHFGSIKSRAHVWGCSCGSFAPVRTWVCSQKHLATVQSMSTCLIDSSSAPHTSQFGTGFYVSFIEDSFCRKETIDHPPPEHSDLRWDAKTPYASPRNIPWSRGPSLLCLLPMFVVNNPISW